MLTLTENASSIVKEITAQVPGDKPGLRIATESPEDPNFQVTAAAEAEQGDQVVERDGATVYVEPVAAQVLDAMVLDAAVDTSGNVEFGLSPQA